MIPVPVKNKLEPVGDRSYDSRKKIFNSRLTGPVNVDSIRKFIQEHKEKLSPSSMSVNKSALKNSILRSIHDIRVRAMIEMVFKEIKVPKADKKVYRERILELQRFIKESPERVSLIVKTFSITGLRVSELCSILKSNCKIEIETVYNRVIGKGKKERRVFIPVHLYGNILRAFPGKNYLFTSMNGSAYDRRSIWRMVNDQGKKIIGKSIHPHIFRHTFVTGMVKKKNGSLKAVSRYVGHSSVSTTDSMYVHDELKPEELFK